MLLTSIYYHGLRNRINNSGLSSQLKLPNQKGNNKIDLIQTKCKRKQFILFVTSQYRLEMKKLEH